MVWCGYRTQRRPEAPFKFNPTVASRGKRKHHDTHHSVRLTSVLNGKQHMQGMKVSSSAQYHLVLSQAMRERRFTMLGTFDSDSELLSRMDQATGSTSATRLSPAGFHWSAAGIYLIASLVPRRALARTYRFGTEIRGRFPPGNVWFGSS